MWLCGCLLCMWFIVDAHTRDIEIAFVEKGGLWLDDDVGPGLEAGCFFFCVAL